MGQIGAYGVLTIKAFAVDAMTVKRAATENNFIVGLEDEGRGRGGRTPTDFPPGGIYCASANLRSNNNRDP